MSELYDRYLNKVATGRTSALVEQVRSYGKHQAAIEGELLGAVANVTEGELARILGEARTNAKAEPATQWDLLKSQQATRLALYKLVFDLRAMIWVIVALAGGVFIGFLIWGRSPPCLPSTSPPQLLRPEK